MHPIYTINTQPSPPDQRDISFVPTILRPDFKRRLDLIPEVEEVEDQLTIGSCVGNGVVSKCELLGKKRGKHYDLSRLFLYTATLDFEGRLGQEGLFPRDAYKVAYKYGICSEEGPNGYPYDITKAGVRPPDWAYLEASKTRVRRYEAVIAPQSIFGALERDQKVDRILSALNEGLPVGIALQVTRSIYSMKGDWENQKYLLGNEDNYVGGHFMVIVGYDDDKKMFLVQNSWGKNWGDGGFGGFPYAIVDELFFEAWIIRDFDGNTVPEVPGIKFEGVNRFKIEARITPEPNEVGKPVKIWMAAKVPNGYLYTRQQLRPDQIGAGPNGVQFDIDNWTPFHGELKDLPPVTENYILQEDNHVVVVQWRSLVPFAGVDIYLAYGEKAVENWKVKKLCTVPMYD